MAIVWPSGMGAVYHQPWGVVSMVVRRSVPGAPFSRREQHVVAAIGVFGVEAQSGAARRIDQELSVTGFRTRGAARVQHGSRCDGLAADHGIETIPVDMPAAAMHIRDKILLRR
jgi:hypothetical protein